MPTTKQIQIDFPLLTNGLDFINSAVEYLGTSTNTPRGLKYATLHLAAGIELVLKERLHREHWTQVFAKPDQARLSSYQSGDFQSVNLDECVKRLENICGVCISPDHMARIRSLRDKRNRLEHFGILESSEALKASSAEALSFIIDFVNDQLEPEKFLDSDTEMLEGIRQQLSNFTRFVSQRWDEIQQQVDKSTCPILTCPDCNQDALTILDGVRCLFCGYEDTPDKACIRYANEILGITRHDVVVDGADWPIHQCPRCGIEALVDHGTMWDTTAEQFVCFNCGEQWREDQLATCARCGELYCSSEHTGLCHECWKVIMEQD